jgi:anti-anti-sigma factor
VRFDACVGEAVASAARTIVVDLADCTFLDSSGLGVIVRAGRTLETQRRTLMITGARGIVRRVLELAAIDNW